MRIHALEIDAFGPFAGRVTLDVDRVGAAGLFLVQGPTGAGKTSILDAVCFALYASVPGARPAGTSLRSDHASPDAIPRVRIDFTAAGRRLRITRSPEFLRPKLRGTGTVKEPTKVYLEERIAGAWVPRSTRADEVGEIVDDVLGMGLAQFSRVVVLPQGEFAAFLRSKPEERRALLERLFDVSAFAGTEAWLAESRRSQSHVVSELRRGLEQDLARLGDVLARVPADAVLGGLPDLAGLPVDGLPAVLEAVRERLAAFETQALAEHDAAVTADRAATSAREAATARAAARRRGLAARAELLALDSESDIAAEDATRLARGEAAVAVRGELAAVSRSAASADTARRSDQSARAALREVAPTVADEPVEDSLRRARSCDADLALLARNADDLADCRISLTAARAHLGALTEQATADPALLADLSAADASARGALADAQGAAAGVPAAEERVLALTRRRTAREQLEATTTRLATAVADEATARELSVSARELLVELREARIAGMAGELAGDLLDDRPCPVCGATEHPTPASVERVVAPDEIERAATTADEAAGRLTEAMAFRAGLESRIAGLRDEIGDDDRDTSSLMDALTVAGDVLRELRATAADQEALHTAAARAAADLESGRAAVAGRSQELAVAAGRVADVETELQRLETLVDSGLTGHVEQCPGRCSTDLDGVAGVPDLVARHHEVTRRLAATDTCATRARAAAESHEQAVIALESACAAADFTDSADARAAVLSDPDLADLRRTVEDRRTRRAALETTLSDVEVLAALEAEADDLQSVAQASESARVALLTTRDRRSTATTTNAEFDTLARRLSDAAQRLVPAGARLTDLSELAELVGGTSPSNTMRMRLSSFVLAARLERVVSLANERLALIGDGRYRLRHDDSLATHGRRSGLGLLIQDLWTGQTRDTSTLSGGESFMASLALALGLAEAVREESGGRDLQTLFIDEGFGTLDEGSLEQVMSVLDSLREGGRAVGVVSHVSDLRSRIPHQIVVDKTSQGSTVRVLTGPAAGAA